MEGGRREEGREEERREGGKGWKEEGGRKGGGREGGSHVSREVLYSELITPHSYVYMYVPLQYLYSECWVGLFEDYVPDVQGPTHACGIEHSRACGAPTPVCQVRLVIPVKQGGGI